MDAAWFGLIGSAIGALASLGGTVFVQWRAEARRRQDRLDEERRLLSERRFEAEQANFQYYLDRLRNIYSAMNHTSVTWLAKLQEGCSHVTRGIATPDTYRDAVAALKADFEEQQDQLIVLPTSGEMLEICHQVYTHLTGIEHVIIRNDVATVDSDAFQKMRGRTMGEDERLAFAQMLKRDVVERGLESQLDEQIQKGHKLQVMLTMQVRRDLQIAGPLRAPQFGSGEADSTD